MPGTSNFPVALDTFPDILPTTHEDDTGFEHDIVHNNEAAAIAALQAKVGVDGSADTSSLDYLVAGKADRDADQTFRTRHGLTGGGDIYTRDIIHGPSGDTEWADASGNVVAGVGVYGGSLAFYIGATVIDSITVDTTTGDVDIPALTSTTQAPGDNSTNVATTAYADAAAADALADANTYTDAAVAGLGAIHYRRDDFTATGYENQFAFDKTPYESAIDLFKNGVLIAEAAYTIGSVGGHTTALLATPAAAAEVYTAKYWTGTASPGATTFGQGADPSFASVVSLLHCDGTNGSTTFTDVTGVTWTAGGNAQLSTAQKKFGTASGLFDGSGDYVDRAANSGVTFGTGDFTIEAFANFSGSGNRFVFSFESGWGVYVGGGSLIFYNGSSNLITGGSPGAGWHHIALVRASGTAALYLDGIQQGTASVSTNFVGTAFRVGAYPTGVSGMNGYIDDVRITKGVARYAGSSFAPPASPFPDS